MGITIAGQVQEFFLSCLLGFILGVIYDIFRILRLFLKFGKKRIFLQDVIYMGICAVITFLFSLVTNYGEFRFYVIAGEILGFCSYYFTIGRLVGRLYKVVMVFARRFYKKLNGLIFIPAKNFLHDHSTKLYKLLLDVHNKQNRSEDTAETR